jgi:hypothetical protein
MSIDADIAGNTVTADLGTAPPTPHPEVLTSREFCVRGLRNGVQDFDEDAADLIALDITLEGYNPPPAPPVAPTTLSGAINNVSSTLTYSATPPSADPFESGDGIWVDSERMRVTSVNTATNNLTVVRGFADTSAAAHASGSTISMAEGMVGWGVALLYEDSAFTVSENVGAMMIGALAASDPIDTSFTPTEGDDRVEFGAIDSGFPGSAETGSGVLSRVSLEIDPAAASGMYELRLANAEVINTLNETNTPNVLRSAKIAIGTPCPSEYDGDGFSEADEIAIGTNPEDPCGEITTVSPIFSRSWPADLKADGEFSVNRVDLQDIASFLAPTTRFNTSSGDLGFHVRWDISPGNGPSDDTINIIDLGRLLTVAPEMFGGSQAFNHETPCTP